MSPDSAVENPASESRFLLSGQPDRVSSPSPVELTCLVGITFLLFITIIASVRGYGRAIDEFADSSAYMSIASALRHWDFRDIVVKQFWGLPYAMAGLSKVTGLPDRVSLMIFSLIPSLISVLLVRRLWDGWVAALFAILNFDWLQRSCLGGSEPLFVCLLLASFLNVKQRRWMLASLLASFGTVVRPLGIFALVGIGLTLLWQRDFRRFAAASAIGVAVGIFYALPVALHFGDAFANVTSYHSKEWQGGWLFGFPFYAIIKGTITYPAPWTNLILSCGWIALVVAAIVVMLKSEELRAYWKSNPVEALFLVPYLWCIFSYNYPSWARSNFPRFAIPILPFVFLALHRWLPRDRRIVWALGAVSSVLAACSALGLVNVIHMFSQGH